MKRTSIAIFAALGIALFAGLVYAVLIAAHVAEPAAITIEGVTPRRLWATTAVLLGLAGVIIGRLGLPRSAFRIGGASRSRAIFALCAGFTAALNGGMNLAIAKGGPGSGNGVVGGAAAFVLGLAALTLGGLGLARTLRKPLAPER